MKRKSKSKAKRPANKRAAPKQKLAKVRAKRAVKTKAARGRKSAAATGSAKRWQRSKKPKVIAAKKPKKRVQAAEPIIVSPVVHSIREHTKQIQSQILDLLQDERPRECIEIAMTRPSPAIVQAMAAIRSRLTRLQQTIH